MAEAKAQEGLKINPIWCLYCPHIIIPVPYIDLKKTANFVGSDIQIL
jgi:hypothetical protein